MYDEYKQFGNALQELLAAITENITKENKEIYEKVEKLLPTIEKLVIQGNANQLRLNKIELLIEKINEK